MVRNLPLDGALARALHGTDALWTLDRQLLAAAVDELRTSNWMRSKDGAKNRNRPKPIPRPGTGDRRYGSARGMTPEQVRDRIAQATGREVRGG